ncbi:MAG: hypothetical protein MMC23_006933 [Stictis urceolatum]|nr:hypothetical protein [Stictis urceolata]
MTADANSTARTGPVDVEFLIVGLGPAGASLACFLTSYGLKGIAISSAPSTSKTPRAHITNMAALECLRDIGLYEECKKLGNAGEFMKHTRFCYSMAGEEWGRIPSWGSEPKRMGDYETASPCIPMDLPQTLLEPLLLKHASQSGFECRFSTTLVGFTKEASGRVLSTLQDEITGATFQIRSKYLFGADGARSKVVRDLNLPLIVKPSKGVAYNVLVKADLSKYMSTRMGNLHAIIRPDKPHPLFGNVCIARMVKPWHEWMFILFPAGEGLNIQPSTDPEDYVQHVRNLIGDDSIPIDIADVSRWAINETVAESYSEDNTVFCLGDAVHRHPPMNGLGSNTCIQDAYNLAWKIAYVEHGQASPSLLSTYTTERQPVGLGIITRANQAIDYDNRVYSILGATEPSIDLAVAAMEEMRAATPAGVARRKAFQEAIYGTRLEFHGLGVEMGQRYLSAAMVADPKVDYSLDDADPYGEERIEFYHPSTVPGRRLPHVWLNKAVPQEQVSTQDLAGKGAFALFTGIGGEAWKEAARRVGGELGVKINAFSLAFRQDWEDVYCDWARLRGVEESGCVLVRPDRVVAWRCEVVMEDAGGCERELRVVLRKVLGWEA